MEVKFLLCMLSLLSKLNSTLSIATQMLKTLVNCIMLRQRYINGIEKDSVDGCLVLYLLTCTLMTIQDMG